MNFRIKLLELNLNSIAKSAIKDHILYSKTDLSVNNFEVIKKCNTGFEAKIQEALLIKKFNPTLNRQLYSSGANLLRKGTDVSISTASRRLSREFGLKSCKPAKKPKLTPMMKKKRLAFAKKHLYWTADYWGKVLFSDESTFQQFVVLHKHVRRPVEKRFDEKYTSATIKHPPSQMIWGAMSKNGTAGLYFLTTGTTMNGSKYVDLLKSKLLLHMSVHNTSIFMQNGAPCHHSKIVKKFLGDNNVVTLDWPGNSPDLNPIENL